MILHTGLRTDIPAFYSEWFQNRIREGFVLVRTVPQKDRIALGQAFAATGARYGITVRACAEGDELAPFGVDCNGCMTLSTFEKALHKALRAPKLKNSRNGQCACYLTCDIGAYDTCAHLCRYCYANANASLVIQNRKRHDPLSPLLVGHLLPEDRVHEAKQESWRDGQLELKWD